MSSVVFALFATLSIFDYPARQPMHERLSRQFIVASRQGDTATMEETCRKGVQLLPDDPTWHYNLACSLAYFGDRETEAFDELEKAIDFGFRDVAAIEKDADLKRIAKSPRFAQLVEYAKEIKGRPLMLGPMANVPATGIFGKSIALGEQNFAWDFDFGVFVAKLKLAKAVDGANLGDIYMNRDHWHSSIAVKDYPGLTEVRLDNDGRARNLDTTIPNILFPYPVFGNSSMAYANGAYWRSIPRALMTTEVLKLKRMQKFYLSNQVWVFPSNLDTAPVGTNGDVFASITPYWLTSAGRSYSDKQYLRAAIETSAAFKREVKAELVKRDLLAPTIMTLIRKNLKTVESEDDYLTARAHPTALPSVGVDSTRLADAARSLSIAEIPPLVTVTVRPTPPRKPAIHPELTYASSFAWAFVLRAEDETREFFIEAQGAREYAFFQSHGEAIDCKIDRIRPDSIRLTLGKSSLNPTNRLDITIVGRNPGTGWGAPAYVSFARMDHTAPYSDPALTILPPPEESK